MYCISHPWLKAQHSKRETRKLRCYCWWSPEVLSVLLAPPLPLGWVNKIWSWFLYGLFHCKSMAAYWIIRNSQTSERDEIKTKQTIPHTATYCQPVSLPEAYKVTSIWRFFFPPGETLNFPLNFHVKFQRCLQQGCPIKPLITLERQTAPVEHSQNAGYYPGANDRWARICLAAQSDFCRLHFNVFLNLQKKGMTKIHLKCLSYGLEGNKDKVLQEGLTF